MRRKNRRWRRESPRCPVRGKQRHSPAAIRKRTGRNVPGMPGILLLWKQKMKLSDIVVVDAKRWRSVNLERDLGEMEILKNYHLTGRGLRCLNRFMDSLDGAPRNAWSLTGPYGMGKSSFLHFLLSLTAPASSDFSKMAFAKLRNSDSHLASRMAKRFKKIGDDRPFLHVFATSAYEPVNKTLIRALLHGLKEHRPPKEQKARLKNLVSQVEKLSESNRPSSSALTKAFESAKEICGIPLLVVVDEFGKNLEFQTHHADRGDLFMLQRLSESRDTWLWVCLHQAFSEYSNALSNIQREEWQKIQGRFDDISFVEPAEQMTSLIRESLRQNRNGKFDGEMREWAEHFSQSFNALKIPGAKPLTAGDVKALFPIHPLAAFALVEICRRFAQNDRTLFSFLCGGDPKALPAFLDSKGPLPDHRLPTLSLDLVFDYFDGINVGNARPEGRRWLEIRTMVDKFVHLPDEQVRAVKTIGLLNLLNGLKGCARALAPFPAPWASNTRSRRSKWSMSWKAFRLPGGSFIETTPTNTGFGKAPTSTLPPK